MVCMSAEGCSTSEIPKIIASGRWKSDASERIVISVACNEERWYGESKESQEGKESEEVGPEAVRCQAGSPFSKSQEGQEEQEAGRQEGPGEKVCEEVREKAGQARRQEVPRQEGGAHRPAGRAQRRAGVRLQRGTGHSLTRP